MIDWSSKLVEWASTGVTVGSLVFGGGVLYADVQDIKRDVSKSEGLAVQTQVLETKLNNAEKVQEKTILVLEKLSDNVEQLGVNVARLEGRLNREK
ncbi:hypothetical protein D3C78_759440 [compost metagenome]